MAWPLTLTSVAKTVLWASVTSSLFPAQLYAETRQTIIKPRENAWVGPEWHKLLSTGRVKCVQPWSILVMRREKRGRSQQTMGSSDCRNIPLLTVLPALKWDTRDGAFFNISFFLWWAFIPDIFKMCFNLEKDKTEILQESKWSLKPRALHINNVVSLKKTTQKPNSKAQTMNVFIFQVEYEDTIHCIYPCIVCVQYYSWCLKKYYLSLFERANVQSLQTIGGSRNVLKL